MPFQNLCMKVGDIIGGESLIRPMDMPRKDLYREIEMRLTVNINITTLGTPVLKAHSPAAWLKRIELIADGKDTIKSLDARALVLKNFFLYGNYPRRTVPTLATGDNYFYQTIHIPLAMPHTARPIDTLIDSSLLSTFELRTTWGVKLDGFVTAPTAYTLSVANASVHLLSAINLSEGALALNVYKEGLIEVPLTATTTNLQALLPVGNLYRGFLITAEKDGELQDNLINRVTLQSGTTVYWSQTWAEIQGHDAMAMDMESQAFVGAAYVDFCPDGRLIDALDSSKLSMLQLVFDVTYASGTCYVKIYPDEVIVPVVVRAKG